MKKILLASLFLGGGYYFINKLLPTLKSNSKELEIETKDYEDELAEKERIRLRDSHYNEDGSRNQKWYQSRNNFKL